VELKPSGLSLIFSLLVLINQLFISQAFFRALHSSLFSILIRLSFCPFQGHRLCCSLNCSFLFHPFQLLGEDLVCIECPLGLSSEANFFFVSPSPMRELTVHVLESYGRGAAFDQLQIFRSGSFSSFLLWFFPCTPYFIFHDSQIIQAEIILDETHNSRNTRVRFGPSREAWNLTGSADDYYGQDPVALVGPSVIGGLSSLTKKLNCLWINKFFQSFLGSNLYHISLSLGNTKFPLWYLDAEPYARNEHLQC